MKGITVIAGLVLFILGILLLVYGGFTYTKETHDADLGPVSIELKEREHVNVPVWVGVAVTVLGVGLLVFGRRMPGIG